MSFQMKHLIFPVGKPCKLTVQCKFPLRMMGVALCFLHKCPFWRIILKKGLL